MKKTRGILMSLAVAACLVNSNAMLAQDKAKSKGMEKEKFDFQSIKDWPEASQKAAKEIVDKYGKPNSVTSDMLIWNNNGIWLQTIVYKKEMKHDFPMAHTDVIEQWVNYRVMPEKYDDIIQYDGSITINRTNGTISARCDKEAMNILALNLALDIINGTKSVAQARADYGKNAMAVKGGEKPAYTQKLNFSNDKSAPDPDKPLEMEMKASLDGTAPK